MNKSGKYTIDRFEKDLAVLLLREDETIEVLIKKEDVPNACEGDILYVAFTDEGELELFRILEDETNAVKEEVNALLKKLSQKNR